MSRAILVCFHKYTPFGGEFYEGMLDFFMQQMKKYKNEFDRIYLLDSNWNIHLRRIDPGIFSVIRVDPQLRYYDAYKEVLPQVKEDLVLFMDNDMVVYKPEIIKNYMDWLEPSDSEKFDVLTIMDTIGEYKTDKLWKGNKFCPYFFATRKDLLMKYLAVDWGSNMPHSETFGKLTEAMVNDNVKVYEMEDDKSSIHFDGSTDPTESKKSKNLGYMHIRAGSTPAYLLATKHYGNLETYQEYIIKQPKQEFLRQSFWYQYMGGNPSEIVSDVEITKEMWDNYYSKALNYYGLL